MDDYLLKMVIFHSYVNVYQRILASTCWEIHTDSFFFSAHWAWDSTSKSQLGAPEKKTHDFNGISMGF